MEKEKIKKQNKMSKKAAISLRVDEKFRYGLELSSRKQHISVSDAVVQAVATYLETNGFLAKQDGEIGTLLDHLWSESSSERMLLLSENTNLATFEETKIGRVIKDLDTELKCQGRSYSKTNFFKLCDLFLTDIEDAVQTGKIEKLVTGFSTHPDLN